jgi:2-polyprenyl-3-methyl-5-hydroxy-6-metoxy-1,4-benzoquinol methylase
MKSGFPVSAPLFFVDLRTRSFEEERMDSPSADPALLHRTIEQFGLINGLFSGSLRLFKRHLAPIIAAQPERVWTMLDFGSGGADIDRVLVDECRRRGWKIQITALDLDPRVLPWARELSEGYPEITPVTGSVFDLPKMGDFDFIVSNHTLHHLPYPDVRRAVELSLKHARHGVLLNDLRRSFWAYVGFTIFAGLFVRGSLAWEDGRLSIRRGFTRAELEHELQGLPGLRIGDALPARLYLYRE